MNKEDVPMKENKPKGITCTGLDAVADEEFCPVCIVLYSSCCMDPIQEQDQRRCMDLMKGKGVPFSKVDGSDGETRELRNTLWSVSGHRGKYPQVFVEREGEYDFVGLWSDVESMNECEALPKEILVANPEIKTFKAAFGDLVVERGPPRPPGGRKD